MVHASAESDLSLEHISLASSSAALSIPLLNLLAIAHILIAVICTSIFVFFIRRLHKNANSSLSLTTKPTLQRSFAWDSYSSSSLFPHQLPALSSINNTTYLYQLTNSVSVVLRTSDVHFSFQADTLFLSGPCPLFNLDLPNLRSLSPLDYYFLSNISHQLHAEPSYSFHEADSKNLINLNYNYPMS